MTRDFLEGARKKRISYTPRGLYEAWRDLDPAKKVYVGTVAGLVISVRAVDLKLVVTALIKLVLSCHRPLLWVASLPCVIWIFWRSYRLPKVSPGR